jgi:hypothetical protein
VQWAYLLALDDAIATRFRLMEFGLLLLAKVSKSPELPLLCH